MGTNQVWAILMVKDESDILGATLDHLFSEGIDGALVSDNLSSDGTPDILSRLQNHYNLHWHTDPQVAYYQADKMTQLADIAAQLGAEWIVPVDADELWYSWGEKNLADTLRESDAQVAGIPLWNHFATDKDLTGNPFERMVYRHPDRGALDKIAYRYHSAWTIEMGNHGVRDGQGNKLAGVGLTIGIRHFPYRSFEQFKRKVINGSRAYAATNLPWWYGTHWRDYGRAYAQFGDAGLRPIWSNFYYPGAQGLLYDPAPFMKRVMA